MLKRFGLRRWGNTKFGTILLLGAAVIGVVGADGCRKPAGSAVSDSGPDPADENMAPVSDVGTGYGGGVYADEPAAQSYGTLRPQTAGKPSGRVLARRQADQRQQTAEQYPDATNGSGGYTQAPIERRSPEGSDPQSAYNQDPQSGYNQQAGYNAGYTQNGGVAEPSYDTSAYSNVTEVADQPPPPLPVYEQPPAPEPDDLWTPGYWNYAVAGYYWVPGAWVAAPYRGALWTPGYWGAYRGRYGYHPGFWGQHVGFYGGIAYGFGYFGSGYRGGYWKGDHFNYNRAVTNVNVANIHNVYNRAEIVDNTTINNTVSNRYVNNVVNRVSYNGGPGGVPVRPGLAEVAALRTPRIAPMATQIAVQESAAADRRQFYAANGGRPAVAAAPRPVVADRTLAAPPASGAVPGMRPGVPAAMLGSAAAVQGFSVAGHDFDRLRAQQQQQVQQQGRVGQGGQLGLQAGAGQVVGQAGQTGQSQTYRPGQNQTYGPGQSQTYRRPGDLPFVQGQPIRNGQGAQGGNGQPVQPGNGQPAAVRAGQRQNAPSAPAQVQTRVPAELYGLPIQSQGSAQLPAQPSVQLPVRGAQGGGYGQTVPPRGRGDFSRGQQGPQRNQTSPLRDQTPLEGLPSHSEMRGQQGGRGQAEVERQRPETNGAQPQAAPQYQPAPQSRPTVQEVAPRMQTPSMVRSAPQTQAQPRAQPEARPSGPPARPSGPPAREERGQTQGDRPSGRSGRP